MGSVTDRKNDRLKGVKRYCDPRRLPAPEYAARQGYVPLLEELGK